MGIKVQDLYHSGTGQCVTATPINLHSSCLRSPDLFDELLLLSWYCCSLLISHSFPEDICTFEANKFISDVQASNQLQGCHVRYLCSSPHFTKLLPSKETVRLCRRKWNTQQFINLMNCITAVLSANPSSEQKAVNQFAPSRKARPYYTEKFGNARTTITGHFGFLLEENSGREITGL